MGSEVNFLNFNYAGKNHRTELREQKMLLSFFVAHQGLMEPFKLLILMHSNTYAFFVCLREYNTFQDCNKLFVFFPFFAGIDFSSLR